MAKEVVSCDVCKSGNKESVAGVKESDVIKSNGGHFWQKISVELAARWAASVR